MIDEPKIDLNELTGGACRRLPSPCPHTTCRYNLRGERVQERGQAGQAIEEPCVLNIVADGGERTLEQVGHMLGVTRERVRQIETQAMWSLACGLRQAGIATRGEIAVRRVGKRGGDREVA